MADLRIEYVKTADGVSIGYASIGQGPTIVMSPNLLGDVNMYSHQANPFADELAAAGRTVVMYDARGSGSSDRDVTDFTLDARVLDLEAVVERIGAERFGLAGSLHGGPVAVAYAVRHPERLTHLLLSSSYIRGSDYYTTTPYTRAIRALSDMATEDWEFFTLNLAHWAMAFRDGEFSKRLAVAFEEGLSPEFYLKAVEAVESIDVSALLPQISTPTLIAQDATSVLAVDAGKPFASAIPGAQLVSVRGREAVVAACIEFLSAKDEPAADTQSERSGGMATVLFTDLVGHTEMMSRLGDEKGREVLREHEEITREVLREHGGTEVKTMGDGFMASFGSVTRAVECAIALQRAFANREGEPLSVRVGLNAGEPIEEDGDLFGATVILASRIAAKADGREILVADTVRGLCSGKGFVFSDRGEFLAKGFEEPVRVYEVRWREGALGEAASVMTKSKAAEDFWLEPGAPEFSVDPGPHEPTAETVKILMTIRQTAGDEVKPVVEWSGANVDPRSPLMMPENQRPGARYQKYQLKPVLARPAPPEDEVVFDVRFRWQGATRQYRWRWPLYIREKGIWGMNNTAENVLEPAERTTLD